MLDDRKDVFVHKPSCGGGRFHDAPPTTRAIVRQGQRECEKDMGGVEEARQSDKYKTVLRKEMMNGGINTEDRTVQGQRLMRASFCASKDM